jgi:hypothetical protein
VRLAQPCAFKVVVYLCVPIYQGFVFLLLCIRTQPLHGCMCSC